MKWAYYVKYKVMAVLVLLAIIVSMLLSNLSHRNNFSRLDDAVVSIYNDRLMPSTFIFRITDHLYQKQLLLQLQMPRQAKMLASLNSGHDKAIAGLIRDYETTHLTALEKAQWIQFKDNLSNYNTAFSGTVLQLLLAGNTGNGPALAHNPYFDKAVENLNALSNIQVSEAKDLSRDSRNIISYGVLLSHFEISLLLILGIAALVIMSAGTTGQNILLRRGNWLN